MPDVLDQETVARAALAEISPPGTVGALLESTATEDGVAQLSFASTLSGYPGWHWSVSVAEIPGEEPTVMEAELMPGDGALLAPDWVPWAERLEDYRAAQLALAADADDADLTDEADDDETDEDDDEYGLGDDDDLGVDPHEGIDFDLDDELVGVAASGVDEQDESEDEPADDGPEQPDES
ncbi:DUF3027 domain-containing protein [Pseudolysinimonas sp.]|jgi:hypothetical protein|uniref:DUF3027 domain-containing protein n=1 Tax=Pseudolysinimonas sp. TaxID=2680009 RepID=UPI003784BDA7